MTAPRNTWDEDEDDLSFTERMDRLYPWPLNPLPPTGSLEEKLHEDAKWERDDEPPEDED